VLFLHSEPSENTNHPTQGKGCNPGWLLGRPGWPWLGPASYGRLPACLSLGAIFHPARFYCRAGALGR
jgi:hypothetical protein